MAKSIKVALELDTRDFDKGVKDAKRELGGLNSELEKGSGRASNFGLGMAGVTAALAGVAGAALGLKSALDAAQSVENLGITLQTLYGDAESAAAAMEIVSQQAAGLTFALSDIQSGVPSLALVEDKLGGLDNAIQFTSGIASAFGMSFQEAATNVQRALTAGIGSADLFRDKGVKAFLGFQEGVEYTAAQTQELMLNAFEEVTAANELAAGTLTGQFSMIEDAAFQVSEAFGTAFGETLKELLGGLNESFAQNKERILEIARALGENLGRALTLVINNADLLVGLFAGLFAAAVVTRVMAVATAIVNFSKALAAGRVAAIGLMALTGPAGWAAIAAGVTAAGAAVMAMNATLGDQEVQMEGIKLAQDGLNESINTGQEEALERAEARDQAQRLEEERIRASQKAEEERNAKQEEIAEKEASRAAKEEERAQAKAEADAKRAAAQEEREQAAEERRQERHQKEMLRAQEVLAQAEAKMEADLADIEATVEKIGLSETQIKQLEMTNELNREREEKLAEIARYNISDAEKNELQARLNELYDEQIAKQYEAIAVTDEQQRKFSTGWQNAWADYKDAAEDNSKIAGQMFDTVTRGMEDAFVDFVMTGKASFKDLIDEMIKQLLRIVAKKIFVAIIDLLTGGIGSIFAGFFDKGGMIPQGKFGVVGEKGPEIVTGPARVIGRLETESILGGAGQQQTSAVTYNINAVDARSFKQLVASDPEFIYNVTVAGQRRLPA
jgi:lambda family phage tail tape measure protein